MLKWKEKEVGRQRPLSDTEEERAGEGGIFAFVLIFRKKLIEERILVPVQKRQREWKRKRRERKRLAFFPSFFRGLQAVCSLVSRL